MSLSQCVCRSGPAPFDVTGVPVHTLGSYEALVLFESFLDCPGTHVVNHLAVDPIARSRRDPKVSAALRRSDLNLADGMGVVWGARLLGARTLRERVYGPDFLLKAAELGIDRGVRHAFVGGTPDLLERLQSRLLSQLPAMRIVGAYAPPFREIDEGAVTEDLAALGADADVIWVGLGVPKQLIWADLAREHSSAHVISTVGAAFDFLSGEKRQAPPWMQARGLEWAFRLSTEPRRLWRRYLVGNTQFLGAVLMQRIRERRSAARV